VRNAVAKREVLVLSEWDEAVVPGALSAADLRMCSGLARRGQDARLEVRQLQGGISIRTRGAVGFVRFDAFDVRIAPKLPGDAIQLFRLVAYAAGIDALRDVASAAEIGSDGEALPDFFIRLLTREAERILRAGPRVDYVHRQDELGALRGRLLFEEQVRRRHGQMDRLVCTFDELEHDILDNRLVAIALDRGRRLAVDPEVRRRCTAISTEFAAICNGAALDLGTIDTALVYDRMNLHYRPAHALARLVLTASGPLDELRPGSAPARSFLIDLAQVFERFVSRLVADTLGTDAYVIAEQKRSSIYWRGDTQKPYASVRPDLLVAARQAGGVALPIDAKYKRYGPDGRSYDSGDLSQAFVYAYAYRPPVGAGAPRALLIHPSTKAAEIATTALQVRSVDDNYVNAEVTGIGVHIPTMLDAVEMNGRASVLDDLRDLIVAAIPPRNPNLPSALPKAAPGPDPMTRLAPRSS
jgi:5-methylcytosine-specific restriction enzyme subunit McrC